MNSVLHEKLPKKKYSLTLDKEVMDSFKKMCEVKGMKQSTRIEILVKPAKH